MAHLRFAAPVEQRVALITGGARGIGGAAALRLAEAGRHIAIVDVLAEPAQERVQEIEAIGQQALFVETDVTDEGQGHEAVAQAVAAFGRLDILVCSAGVLGWEKPFFEQTAEQFAKVMQINVHGVYYAHQAAVPHMLERGWGRCVRFLQVRATAARIRCHTRCPRGRSGRLFRHWATLGRDRGCLSTASSRAGR